MLNISHYKNLLSTTQGKITQQSCNSKYKVKLYIFNYINSYIGIFFTDQNPKPLETEDKILL